MSGNGIDEGGRGYDERLLSTIQATGEQVDEVSRSVIMSSLNSVASAETGDSERIGHSRKRYSFVHEEITCCSDCPFFYDYLYCEIDEHPKDYKRYTWREDGRRPDWCPLREVRQDGHRAEAVEGVLREMYASLPTAIAKDGCAFHFKPDDRFFRAFAGKVLEALP